MGVSKNRGGKPPKMDGENNGNPYFLMDDLGGVPIVFGNTYIYMYWIDPLPVHRLKFRRVARRNLLPKMKYSWWSTVTERGVALLYTYLCMFLCLCIHVFLYIYTHVFLCVYIYKHIHVRMKVNHLYIHIIYTQKIG